MGYIKFTNVKLIINCIIPLLFFFIFPLQFSQANARAFTAGVMEVDSFSKNQIPQNQEDKSSVSSNNQEDDRPRNSVLSVFFTDEKVDALKMKLIDYGNNHLPQKLRSFYILVIEKSFDYSIILLLVVLILVFIINIILVFSILNFTIKKKSRKERFERIFSKMYEEVILAYIFGSIDWDTTLIKLKRIKRRENRKILISVLMNFKANFKGELEHFIPEIYTKLDLHKDSLKLAHSIHDYKKVQGIMELTHLYPDGAKGMLNKLINDQNDYVRAEAQIAYVRLNMDRPFDFFYELEKPFTKWTQLSVFYLIRLNQLPVPSFAQFLSSKHSYIRNFSLMMITFFQQLENISDVVRMVESPMEQTRFLTYKAINDLRLYDSRELIKKKFENENNKNKLEILKALRNIGEEDDYDFLKEIIIRESVSLKIEACRSIYFMSQKSRERIEGEKDESLPEIELLLAHVTDPRN
ncbi:MAG TPA: hypothetical protein PK335_03965 [Draconibacterium sp.]|nr:hypothetical protein [Draconibacterium sp.]